MRIWKKVSLRVGIPVLVFIGLFLIFVGPWPTYYSSRFEDTNYFQRTTALLNENIRESTISDTPGRLKAGWGIRKITPETGTPLAGYGARRGAPSTGVHDDLYVKALALSDGEDTVVLVGADILIVPENIADLTRKEVARCVGLTANDILFTASHTHSGPGGWAPGFAARLIGGKYDPKVLTLLTTGFSSAIVEAYKSLEPAGLSYGGMNARLFIRNRVRKTAPVDSELSYLLVQQEDGDRCYLVSYSAHATVLGADNMAFSADYPGYLQRYIEKDTGATTILLGGAVGSMGPRTPEGADAFARAQTMGQALGKMVIKNTIDDRFETRVDIVSVGVPVLLPPMQLRLNTSWRVSPFLLRLLGLNNKGWIQGVRVGNLLLIGTPSDFSGEISAELKSWARTQNYDLWILSFCGDYVGYISPDEYYLDTDVDGSLPYETGLMSWCGPHTAAYFTTLIKQMIYLMGRKDEKSNIK